MENLVFLQLHDKHKKVWWVGSCFNLGDESMRPSAPQNCSHQWTESFETLILKFEMGSSMSHPLISGGKLFSCQLFQGNSSNQIKTIKDTGFSSIGTNRSWLVPPLLLMTTSLIIVLLCVFFLFSKYSCTENPLFIIYTRTNTHKWKWSDTPKPRIAQQHFKKAERVEINIRCWKWPAYRRRRAVIGRGLIRQRLIGISWPSADSMRRNQ